MESDLLLLQRHTGFARRLAHALLRDADAADDVVQDAWVAALETPTTPDHPQSWLAAVVRRAAGKHVRSRQRQREREVRAARTEALPSAAEQSAAMEMHEIVLRCLRTLEQPYQSTLLLRFFEDLGPAEIAARTGEKLETVRTRLRRGLAMLRAQLDAGHAGRRNAWVTALLPLSRPTATALPAAVGSLGVVLMSSKIAWSVAAAGVLAAGLLVGELVLAPSAARPVPEAAVPAAAATTTETEPAPNLSGDRTAVGPLPVGPVAVAPALAGRIVVLDEDGNAHEQENGTFALRDAHYRRPPVAVEVQGGRFALATLDVSDFNVVELELGGRAAHFEVERHECRGPTVVEWRAHWALPVELRVLDAATGLDLQGVTVLHDVPHYRGLEHPGHFAQEKVLVADAASPIRLPPAHDQATYWVRTERHAWSHVLVDHRGGGEREVRLAPGYADLVVQMPDVEPGTNLWLRLFPKGDERNNALSQQTDARSAVFEGLAAREYVLRAELGFWGDDPIEVARVEVDLRSGGRHEIRVEVAHELLSRMPAPFAGSVIMPPGHGDLALGWHLRPLGRPPVRSADQVVGKLEPTEGGDAGVRHFDAGRVTPGTYALIFSQLQWLREVEIGPSGERDLRVQLPELGELRLRVFDEGGRPVSDENLSWSRGSPPDSSMWVLGQAAPDAQGVYRILAPLGRITVNGRWSLFSEARQSFDITPGIQEARLEVRRLPSAWVRLVDGEASVPLDWSIDVDVEGPGSGESPRRRVIRDGRALIVGPEPGRCTVRIAAVLGFEPVPERVIELRAGEPEEYVIELRRR